jgi:hypothetical protein
MVKEQRSLGDVKPSRTITSSVRTRFSTTLARIEEDEKISFIEQLSKGEALFRYLPESEYCMLPSGTMFLQSPRTDELILVQEVAQGIISVNKGGKKYQMREVLQFKGDDKEKKLSEVVAFVEAQLRGSGSPVRFKKAKPFQFVGGKKSQYDSQTVARLQELIKIAEVNVHQKFPDAQAQLDRHRIHLKILDRDQSRENPFEKGGALQKQATLQLTLGFEITLAKEWYEEMTTLLTPECLARITAFDGAEWKLRRKTRFHQEFGVPANYDLGRTEVTIDWDTEIIADAKVEKVVLSEAVRDVFEATPGNTSLLVGSKVDWGMKPLLLSL